MTHYRELSKKAKSATPQSESIPGRENEMTKNLAGAYGWKIQPRIVFRRGLFMSNLKSYYDQDGTDAYRMFLSAANVLVQSDPQTYVDEVVYAREHAPSMSQMAYAVGFALAIGGKHDNGLLDILCENHSKLRLTASHLFMALAVARDSRGFGHGVRRFVREWVAYHKEKKDLEYQLLKYRTRQGFNFADILRMTHLKPDQATEALFRFWIQYHYPKEKQIQKAPNEQYMAFLMLQGTIDPPHVATLIEKHRLTWEMVPSGYLTEPVILRALLQDMPGFALIRYLNRFTSYGAIGLDSKAGEDALRLTLDKLETVKLHPVNLLKAKLTYEQGQGEKGKLTWRPLQNIVSALDSAIIRNFDTAAEDVPQIGDMWLFLDTSGSMRGGYGKLIDELTYGAVLSMVMIKALGWQKVTFGSFADSAMIMIDPFLKPRSSQVTHPLDSTNISGVVQWLNRHGMCCGTDAASVYSLALDKVQGGHKPDAFVMITDSESWAGRSHPSQLLDTYRKKSGKKAVAVYLSLTADKVSLVDPNDSLSVDLVGMDDSIPKLVNLALAKKLS